jgi:hypothetical protein
MPNTSAYPPASPTFVGDDVESDVDGLLDRHEQGHGERVLKQRVSLELDHRRRTAARRD